ncbi:Tbingi protein [Diplonema papillatum]|nr:Tbingi protein [Diplonema papillatum]
METIIKDRLTFLIEGDSSVRAFTPNQGGFRIGRGTEEQLYTVTAAIDRNRRKGRYTCLLVFDLARAFDTVDPARLKKRMVERGIPLKLIRWVESFLKGRNAIFRVDGEYGALRRNLRRNLRAVFRKGQHWDQYCSCCTSTTSGTTWRS